MLARMEDMPPPNKRFCDKDEERRIVGNSKIRWLIGVETNIATLRIKNSRETEGDRLTGRRFLTAARIPQGLCNVLDLKLIGNIY